MCPCVQARSSLLTYMVFHMELSCPKLTRQEKNHQSWKWTKCNLRETTTGPLTQVLLSDCGRPQLWCGSAVHQVLSVTLFFLKRFSGSVGWLSSDTIKLILNMEEKVEWHLHLQHSQTFCRPQQGGEKWNNYHSAGERHEGGGELKLSWEQSFSTQTSKGLCRFRKRFLFNLVSWRRALMAVHLPWNHWLSLLSEYHVNVLIPICPHHRHQHSAVSSLERASLHVFQNLRLFFLSSLWFFLLKGVISHCSSGASILQKIHPGTSTV